MQTDNLDEMVVIEEFDEQPEQNDPIDDEAESTPHDEDSQDDDEVDVVQIEGVTPPEQEEEVTQKAPEWVRDLRKSYRAAQAENQKLKAEIERAKTNPTPSGPPQKPKLEDFDYDADEFEAALEKWHGEKLEYDAREKEAAKAVEAQQQEWAATVDSYNKAKSSLKVPDYDLAEEVVTTKLNIEQQAVILQGASNPATLVYALGKNKGKLDELAKITNPVKFAFALAELQSKLKVERRTAPAPEKKVSGSASASAVDATLDRLRDEAMRTGDTSKLMAYKRSMKKK